MAAGRRLRPGARLGDGLAGDDRAPLRDRPARRRGARPESRAAPEEALATLAAPDARRQPRSAGRTAALSRRARRTAAPRGAACLLLWPDPRGAGGAGRRAGRNGQELAAAQPRTFAKVSRRMRYDNPELRERLAAEYVLGTMPVRARRRFERLIADDAGLARMAGDWADRWSPLDDAAPAEEPPARVWRAIEAHIGGGAVATVSPVGPLAVVSRARLLAWARDCRQCCCRGVGDLCRTARRARAGAGGRRGARRAWRRSRAGSRWPARNRARSACPRWRRRPRQSRTRSNCGASPAGRRARSACCRRNFGAAAILRTAQLPPPGGVLAVSLEPPGGSPTGVPTGPVLYQGKVLIRPP